MASPGSCILALLDGRRRGEIGFGRFLRNSSVTVAGLCEGAFRHTAERLSGREVLAIQDTREIVLGGRKARSRGYGPVGRGGQLGGVLLHPVLAVNVMTGELFGVADIAVWNREKRRTVSHASRASADKEPSRWLTGMRRAADVLHRPAQVTVVSDRESDSVTTSADRETISFPSGTMGNSGQSTCACTPITVSTRLRALIAGAGKTRLQ